MVTLLPFFYTEDTGLTETMRTTPPALPRICRKGRPLFMLYINTEGVSKHPQYNMVTPLLRDCLRCKCVKQTDLCLDAVGSDLLADLGNHALQGLARAALGEVGGPVGNHRLHALRPSH